MTPTADLVLDARNITGESPVWRAAEQALYWVDIPQGQLHRWHAPTGSHRHWQAPQMLACVAPTAKPDVWVAGMEDGIYRLHLRPDGSIDTVLLAPVAHALPDMRFNDGRCDRQGRFWAGTMHQNMALAHAQGKLYRLDTADGARPTAQGASAAAPPAAPLTTLPTTSAAASPALLHALLGGLIVPNGLAFSPDGCTMYLSDSHPSVQKIWAFDYDCDSGTPHRRRLFADMQALPGRPDGAAMDVDGGYWICGNDAGLVHRFTPDGRLDRSLALPVKKPAMCAFGGPDLSTLYVTSIRPQGQDLSDQPLAGGVFALRPGTQGMPEPHCGIGAQTDGTNDARTE